MNPRPTGGPPSAEPAVAPLVLTLEIDHQTPLGGSVSSRAGVTRPFTGWAGLASTLTTFLDDGDEQGAGLPD